MKWQSIKRIINFNNCNNRLIKVYILIGWCSIVISCFTDNKTILRFDAEENYYSIQYLNDTIIIESAEQHATSADTLFKKVDGFYYHKDDFNQIRLFLANKDTTYTYRISGHEYTSSTEWNQKISMFVRKTFLVIDNTTERGDDIPWSEYDGDIHIETMVYYYDKDYKIKEIKKSTLFSFKEVQ